ncbi:MAG: hypothetical protein GY757_60465, partial [bacterium]|nr:hypothetical protein [bacterium]
MARLKSRLLCTGIWGPRAGATHQFTRRNLSTILIIWLTVLTLYSFRSPQLHAQTRNESPLAAHYIILIDTTTPSFRSELSGEAAALGSWILRTVNAAVEYSAAVRKPGLRPGMDFISLVFFHYPMAHNTLILDGPYLYTAPDLLLITDINNIQDGINRFLDQNRQRFQMEPRSPINLSRNIVLPFLCGQFQNSSNVTLPGNHIGHIRLISIEDLEGIEVNHRNFENRNEWTRLARWQSFMQSGFDLESMHSSVYYRFDEISGEVTCTNIGDERKIHFNYYEITPNLENVRLEIESTITMEPSVIRGAGGKTGLILRKDRAIRFHTGGHTGYLEWWKQGTGNRWARLGTFPAQTGKIGMPDYQITAGDNNSPLQIDIPRDSPSSFLQKYSFRGVVLVENTPGQEFTYPFVYRCYTPAKNTTFKIAAGPSSIDIKKLMERMNDTNYLNKVRHYWNTDKDLKEKYKYAVKDQRVNALTPALAARVDELIRIDSERGKKKKIMQIGAATVALTGFLFLTLYFGRKPKIKISIEKETDREIVVDLSGKDRVETPIVALEIKNTRWISKKQSGQPLAMDVHFQLVTALETIDHLKFKEGNGFSIKRSRDQQEFRINRDDTALKAILDNITIGDRFKLIFHSQEVEDLLHAEPREAKADFSLTLVKVSGKYKDTGKDLKVKPIENKDTGENQQLDIPVTLRPLSEDTGIKIDSSPEGIETYRPEQKKHILPYSVEQPVQKVFSVVVTNKNIISFAEKTEGMLTLEVEEKGNSLTEFPGFYLKEGGESAELKKEGISVTLAEGQARTVDCFVRYAETGDNPKPGSPRNYHVQCKFNGEEFSDSDVNVDIARSDEKTEAVIAIKVDGRPAEFKEEDGLNIDARGRLLLNHEIEENELTVTTHYKGDSPLAVKDYGSTVLCALEFSNACSTGTGLYRIKWGSFKLVNNGHIIYAPNEAEKLITFSPGEWELVIPDNNAPPKVVKLFLHPKHIHFRDYFLQIQIILDMEITLYP